MQVVLMHDEQRERLFEILRHTPGGHRDLCDLMEGKDDLQEVVAAAVEQSIEAVNPDIQMRGLGMSNSEMLREIAQDGRLAVEVRRHLAEINYESDDEET